MSSLNKVQLIGRLGGDIESFTFQNGDQIYRGSIATSNVWTDQAGQKQESVDWHNIQLKADKFKNVAPFLKKGIQLYVEGKIKTTKSEEKYFTNIHVYNLILLSSDNKPSNTPKPEVDKTINNQENQQKNNIVEDLEEDDLPF